MPSFEANIACYIPTATAKKVADYAFMYYETAVSGNNEAIWYAERYFRQTIQGSFWVLFTSEKPVPMLPSAVQKYCLQQGISAEEDRIGGFWHLDRRGK